MRQAFKTIVGIVVIGLIVVATFLYGNKQRQDQLRHDSEAKIKAGQTSVASTTPTAAPVTASPSASPVVSTGSTNQAPNGATASVPKPTGSSLQASASNSENTTPPSVATKAPTTIPDTGSGALLATPLAIVTLIAMSYTLRSNKSRLRTAAIRSL